MNDRFIGCDTNCSFCGKNVTITSTVQYAMASGEKGKAIKGLHVGSNAFCDLNCFSLYKQTVLNVRYQIGFGFDGPIYWYHWFYL